MVTVLNGPVVDSFDREFRILFAASLPVPDADATPAGPSEVSRQLKSLSDVRFHKHLELEMSDPPSPPLDPHLDWEAMGVVPTEPCSPGGPLRIHEEEIAPMQSPVEKPAPADKNPPVVESFAESRNQTVQSKR